MSPVRARSSADPLPADRWRVAFERTVARHVSGPGPSPLAVTGCTSPAGRLLVSGPAGRHPLAGCSSPVARHRLHVTSADPLPRWPSPLAGCSSADPLAVTAGRLLVTGCTSRQRTRLPRWPSPVARHPLAGCSSADPLAVTRWPVARQRTRWPSPAGRLLVTFERHRLHVTSADPLAVTGCTSRQRTR